MDFGLLLVLGFGLHFGDNCGIFMVGRCLVALALSVRRLSVILLVRWIISFIAMVVMGSFTIWIVYHFVF